MPMPEPIKNLSRLSLAEIEQAIPAQHLPPLDSWNPPLSGHSRIRIARDGEWFHDGEPIRRENLVRLFSTILRREPDGSFVLVTPVEKQSVDVEDAPFAAVELKSDGERAHRTLALRLNIGDLVLVGPDHPLRFDMVGGDPAPYVMVRTGIEARLTRPVFYELANLAIEEGGQPPGIWSQGCFYSMAALA